MDHKQTSFKILAFFAHPDDETMFLGGTLAYLADQEVEVKYVCATRGEGGENGDPPICDRQDLGRVREQELRCAVAALGGAGPVFLDYCDPDVGPGGELFAFTGGLEELAGKLGELIRTYQPQIILTHGPGGEYGHPAHIKAHQGLLLALSEQPDSLPGVYAPAWLSRETGEFIPAPDFQLDISAWKAQKVDAVSCHRTQHDLFLRHGAARAGRTVSLAELTRTTEALCRISSGGMPADTAYFEGLLAKISLPRGVPPE